MQKEKGSPLVPGTTTLASRSRLPVPNAATLASTPGESAEGDRIVMYPYKFPDGKVMYFPTKLSDIKEYEGGDLGVNNLLKKTGFLGGGVTGGAGTRDRGSATGAEED